MLKRVFDIDIERCPRCGGALRIIAAIDLAPTFGAIAAYLGLLLNGNTVVAARRVNQAPFKGYLAAHAERVFQVLVRPGAVAVH